MIKQGRTNTYIYPARFICEESIIIVTFPDLPGCLSQGRSIEEAYQMAQEALAIYCRQYSKRKEELPPPSKMSLIQPESEKEYILLVAVDLNMYPLKEMENVKKNLTIPRWLNNLVVNHKLNCSAILRKALITELKNMSGLSDDEYMFLND